MLQYMIKWEYGPLTVKRSRPVRSARALASSLPCCCSLITCFLSLSTLQYTHNQLLYTAWGAKRKHAHLLPDTTVGRGEAGSLPYSYLVQVVANGGGCSQLSLREVQYVVVCRLIM